MRSAKVAVVLFLLALLLGWVVLSCVTKADAQPRAPETVPQLVFGLLLIDRPSAKLGWGFFENALSDACIDHGGRLSIAPKVGTYREHNGRNRPIPELQILCVIQQPGHGA